MATLADLLALAQASGPQQPGLPQSPLAPEAPEAPGAPGAPRGALGGLLRSSLSGEPLSLGDLLIGEKLNPLAALGGSSGGGLGALGALGGSGAVGGFSAGPTPYSGPLSFQPIATGRVPIVDRTPTLVPNPSVVSPEIQRTAAELWSRWPGLTNMGTHNVRNIAGTSTLSEHSFGDAIDIGGSDEELTEVASWLPRQAAELGITQVIFKDRIWTDTQGWHPYTAGGHDTHVHVTGPGTYSDTSPLFEAIRWHAPRSSVNRSRPSPAPAPPPRRPGLEALRARRGSIR